ncbi:hypothetical protein [Methylopila sp. 73B]|nr:hypothetical protein [Methylopila sp. 73B]
MILLGLPVLDVVLGGAAALAATAVFLAALLRPERF